MFRSVTMLLLTTDSKFWKLLYNEEIVRSDHNVCCFYCFLYLRKLKWVFSRLLNAPPISLSTASHRKNTTLSFFVHLTEELIATSIHEIPGSLYIYTRVSSKFYCSVRVGFYCAEVFEDSCPVRKNATKFKADLRQSVRWVFVLLNYYS